MAGWTAAYDAVFAKYGFIVSGDLDEAVAIAAAFATAPLPRGDRVAVVTVSGGAGAWVADTLAAEGLQVPELPEALQSYIRTLIPSYGSPRNPVDITAQAVHSGGLQKVIELLETSDDIDAIVVVVSLASETRIPVKTDEIKPLIDAQRKPVLFFTYTLPSQFARTELAASGIVAFSGMASLGRAMSRLVMRSRFALASQAEAHRSRLKLPEGRVPERLSEHESKALLREAGIAIPQESLVREKDRLAAALSVAGFPVAMKIQSRDIPHKSEAGGVRINIRDADEAAMAFTELIENARRFNPDADIQGVLVGPMAQPGIEMIVGAIDDVTFGPIVMVGFGGVATELFRDVVYRPAPVSEAEAAAMIGELTLAALLNGFRGGAKFDKTALAKLIAQVSLISAALKGDVSEIEIRVHPEGLGITVVDALVGGRSGSSRGT